MTLLLCCRRPPVPDQGRRPVVSLETGAAPSKRLRPLVPCPSNVKHESTRRQAAKTSISSYGLKVQ
jgi:hypothetical protein